MSEGANTVLGRLLSEILHDAHRYAPGLEQRRATIAGPSAPAWRRSMQGGRERLRDLLERAAGRAGFSHRHFDPEAAAGRLQRLLAMSSGLDTTWAMLGDDASRRAFLDVLKLRVLGPYHAPLAITPQAYRALQSQAERNLRTREGTYAVSDPWFSPLSLYTPTVDGGIRVTLHSHSVDVASVFLLNQYSYDGGGVRVTAEEGEVVLDIGGCWGDTALYFASLVGGFGQVHTFEFDPESLEIMRANLDLNPELGRRIDIVQRALWDRSGVTLEFAQAGRMTTLGEETRQTGANRVETLTLDDFVTNSQPASLDFVKVDVEGAELRVLAGGAEALRRFRPKLAIAAYHNEDDLVTIPAAIRSLGAGYRLYLKTSSPVEDETVLFAVSSSLADAAP